MCLPHARGSLCCACACRRPARYCHASKARPWRPLMQRRRCHGDVHTCHCCASRPLPDTCLVLGLTLQRHRSWRRVRSQRDGQRGGPRHAVRLWWVGAPAAAAPAAAAAVALLPALLLLLLLLVFFSNQCVSEILHASEPPRTGPSLKLLLLPLPLPALLQLCPAPSLPAAPRSLLQAPPSPTTRAARCRTRRTKCGRLG